MKAGGGAKRNSSLKIRARRYPQQPRDLQPPSGIVTLRNSVEILTKLYTYHGHPRGREGEGQTAAQMHNSEVKIARPPRASILHLKLNEDSCAK